MKRYLAFLGACAMLAVSCMEETADPNFSVAEKVRVTLKGYVDDGVTSKTSLNEDFSIAWSATDHITVFSGDGVGDSFEDVTVDESGKTASFTGETSLADSYYAIYPKQDGALYSTADEVVTAILPTAQTGLSGTFADGVNLAVAKSSDDNLYFRNVGALLAVKIPTNYASSVKIVSKDASVKMSGKASFSYNNGEPAVTSSDEAVPYVTMTLPENMYEKTVYFVVYPGEYKGFDIIFTNLAGTHQSKVSSTKTLTLERNDNVLLYAGSFAGWNTPVQPSDVTAELNGLSGVTVSWNSSSDASLLSGFNVYAREAGSTGDGELKATVALSQESAYTCEVSDLTMNTTYEFGVQAVGSSGNKNSEIIWASEEITTPYVDKCLDPTNLKINQLDETSVTLTWQDNSGAETGYRVYKDDGTNVNTADTEAGTTSYTFKYLTVGNTYNFGVQTRGAYANHSNTVYAGEYKVLSWRELQDYDAGDAECLAPISITYTQETNTAVVFSWDCWSSARTGFNLYARPASSAEFSQEHLVASVEKDVNTYIFKNLTTATDYVFGIQTKGSNTLANSDIVEVTMTVKNFSWPYSFESGREIPTFADIALCYGGHADRSPYNWTEERFKETVIYTDADGKEHWFFDSMLMLEIWTDWYKVTYSIANDGKDSATKEHWTQQLDYWFDSTYGFAALDQCIEDAKSRIGEPPTKRYVIFSLPDPIYFENYSAGIGGTNDNTAYWGTIAGDEMDFASLDDQVEAYKWLINQARARFNAANYQNIELAGFYILSEELSVSGSWNYKYKRHDQLIPKVADYCHSFNEGLYWIPYALAAGYSSWTTFGFDLAIMQPNQYWEDETSYSWAQVLDAVDSYNMGIELEFEGTHGEGINSSILSKKADGTANTYAAANKAAFRQYLTKIGASAVYGKKPIALYTGTNALYELATSTDAEDQALYHELGEFIINSPLKK